MHDGVATPSPAPLLVIIAKLLRHDDDTPLHVHTRMGALRPALTAPYAAGGGTAPPEGAERCRAPSHKLRSSSGRGGTAPSESAPDATRPAQEPQLERPRRAYPPVSAKQARHCTSSRCMPYWLEPASGSAHVPGALQARAHTLIHRDTLGRANVANLLIFFMSAHIYHEAICPFRFF